MEKILEWRKNKILECPGVFWSKKWRKNGEKIKIIYRYFIIIKIKNRYG